LQRSTSAAITVTAPAIGSKSGRGSGSSVSPSNSVRLATAIAFGVILVALRAANEEGTLRADDPEIVTRFLLGALRRGAILVATSPNP